MWSGFRGNRSAVCASGRPRPARAAGPLRRPAPHPDRPRPVSSGGPGIEVIGAQYSFPVGQSLLEERDRLAGSAAIPVGGSEVGPGVQGAGMVRSQQPLPPLQVQLVQPDCFGCPACVLVGAGKVVLRGKRFGDHRGQAFAAARPGSARTTGSPRRPGPPQGRRLRGYSASSGCRDGQDPGNAQGPRPTAHRPRLPAAYSHPVQAHDRTQGSVAAAGPRPALRLSPSWARPAIQQRPYLLEDPPGGPAIP